MQTPAYMARAFEVASIIETSLAKHALLMPLLQRFPRDMTKLTSYGFEIPIITQVNLSIRSAANYLCVLSGARHSAMAALNLDRDRRLFGLLHIGPPASVILIDADLSTYVINYVIAHELGHFFGDLLLVRQQWLTQLPEQHEEIQKAFEWQPHNGLLDLQAFLHGLPPRPRPILARGQGELLETEARERQADLVARELLAPWRIVEPLAPQCNRNEIALALHHEFGLPKYIARDYADDIRYACEPPRSLVDRLFK